MQSAVDVAAGLSHSRMVRCESVTRDVRVCESVTSDQGLKCDWGLTPIAVWVLCVHTGVDGACLWERTASVPLPLLCTRSRYSEAKGGER
jgi:hypothetical protein